MLDIIIDIIILTKLLMFTIIWILLQLLVPKKYILVDKQMAESDISSKDMLGKADARLTKQPSSRQSISPAPSSTRLLSILVHVVHPLPPSPPQPCVCPKDMF